MTDDEIISLRATVIGQALRRLLHGDLARDVGRADHACARPAAARFAVALDLQLSTASPEAAAADQAMISTIASGSSRQPGRCCGRTQSGLSLLRPLSPRHRLYLLRPR
jgi:hypothetical protein